MPTSLLSLWEETGEPVRENPRLSAELWLTHFTWLGNERIETTPSVKGACFVRPRSPYIQSKHVYIPALFLYTLAESTRSVAQPLLVNLIIYKIVTLLSI